MTDPIRVAGSALSKKLPKPHSYSGFPILFILSILPKQLIFTLHNWVPQPCYGGIRTPDLWNRHQIFMVRAHALEYAAVFPGSAEAAAIVSMPASLARS